MLAQLRVHSGPLVLLVDDAEGIDDADGAIAGLLGAGRPDLHVVAAARASGTARAPAPMPASGVRRSINVGNP